MRKFVRHRGLAVPLDRKNVDTDAIIPKQFLTSIARTGFGQNLFDEWRYLDAGYPGKDCATRPLNLTFPLNAPHYGGASILLTRDNFGCGSSREHAAWALLEYGFRVVIGPSFADIFYQNSLNNGLLILTLPSEQIDALFEAAQRSPLTLDIDLDAQRICADDAGIAHSFVMDPFRRDCMMRGVDGIDLTLTNAGAVAAFESRHQANLPWLDPVLCGVQAG